MSSSGDENVGVGFDTARDRDWPSIRQFNVFLENRLGALQNLVRRFEASQNRILSLTIWDSADCAIIRIVPSHPERAMEVLQRAKLAFTESDLLVVELPDDPQPLVTICKTLLAAELNIHYVYPLLVNAPDDRPALALHVENIDTAAMTLKNAGLTLLSENDFKQAD